MERSAGQNMRLPPDVVAVLIKIKDYFLLFGPALLIAVSLGQQ